MKRLFILLMLLGSLGSVFGQSTANYAFTTATGTTLEDMSSGTTQLISGPNDDVASSVTNIGFPFYFMGSLYNQFTVNSNGQLRLGSTVISGTSVTAAAASTPYIVPMSGDNYTLATGKVHYKVIGAPPSQILVVEWKDLRIPYSSTGIGSMVQVLLYENTGKIEFKYGSVSNNASTTTTRATFISSSNLANTVKFIGTDMISAIDGAAVSTYTMTDPNTALLNTRVYSFTPLSSSPADPTTLTFTAVTASTITPNWVDNSTDETYYIVTRATDAAFTQNVVTASVPSTSIATTGTAYSLPQTGLTPSTTYFYKIQAANEAGTPGLGLTGSQATLAGAIYYWVGTTGGTWNTPANWNTATDGTGTARTVVATTDVLVVDGDGIVAGVATTINVDLASFSIGQFKVTSNTVCTLQSSAATTRVITITGGAGDDFVIENGSTLNLTNATNAVAFAFSGSGNTGDISGTYNASSSTANVITTTGGTGTIVTVASTGIVNNSILGSSGCLAGSIATLAFANGSNYTHSGFTTSNALIPLATWGATSNVSITGGTSSTAMSNANQTFGNFTYNSATSTGTMSAFTSGTTVIQGNLNVMASNIGKLRAVTTGTLTVNGNLNVSGGKIEVSNNTGIVNVLGNVNVSGGTLDVAFASTPIFRVAGNFIQTAGNIIQTVTTGILEFNGTSAQTLTLISGAHGTNAINARINNSAGVNLTSDFSIRNLTVTNGNLTGAGSLTYNGTTSLLTYNGTTGIQTATAVEFPVLNGPSSLTINNTSATPNNVVSIPFTRSLNGTAGVLTLTSGLLDNSTYVLGVPNTATAGISGGSATVYVKGAIERNLPASLVTGSTYNFPVGKAGYNPFALVNPTTNAGGTVTVKAEVIDANCGGTAGTLMGTLNSNRYWAASITNGSANFTNSLIQLNDAPAGADAIAASSTLTGAYDLVGGTTITATASSLTTTAPAATTLAGYFVMGNKAAPTLTNLVITPAGNQCTNVARTVTVTVTPGGGAITGVVIDYSINGTPQTAITMTNVSGNDWSGVIPTVTPANANVTWSVTATDANMLTKTAIGTPYTDEPLLGVTATASATLSPVCSGSPTVLTVVSEKSGTGTIGSGVTGNSSSTSVGAAYGTYWGNGHLQVLVLASEMSALGFSSGNITSLAFNVTALGNPVSLTNYTIKMGATTATAITTFQAPTFTNVWGPNNYTPVIGANTHTFSTPFLWDGTSNIIVDICYANGVTGSSSAVSTMTTTTFGSFVNYNADGAGGLGACTNTTVSNTSMNRPNITFTGNKAPMFASYTWSDGTSTVGTTNPATVNPLVNTTYTVTATDGNGCILTAGPVVVNTNPLPSTPTATNSSQCGTAVPSCSVTSTTTAPTPVFVWYTVATGGTPIAGISGNTYTGPAISATITFYVAETDGTCESNRVAVTANVVSPDAVNATAATLPACLGNSITLTATQTGSTQTYVYEWAALPVSGSGIATTLAGASVIVTPTTVGTYVYTVTATDAGMGCATTADVSVTINDFPTGVTATASQTTICAGNTVDLSALPNTGTVSVINENFNALTNSWTAINNSTGGTPADAAWTLRADAYNYSGTTFHSNDNSQFYMSNSDDQGSGGTTATILESPTFSTVGMTSCNLSFYHYFNALGDSAVVELFNGTNWIIVNAYTTDIGTATSFVNANINLNSYLNLPSAKIRFRYKSSYGYYWAIDNVVIYGVFPTMTYAWTSAPAGFTSTDQNPVGVTPAATTTYTVAVSNASGCASTASVTVNVTPLPTAPTANNSAQCGTQVPTCSVTSTSGATTPVFNWYAASTGGTPIAGITGNTYTGAAIGTTTTFYVTEADGACESSPRTAVTVTVNLPDAVTASAIDSVCLGQSITLTATQTGSTNTYVYEWAAAPATGSGIPTTVSGTPATVTPTAAGTYVYTATATDAGMGCITTATKSVKVNDLPSGVTATASNTGICLGAPVDLFSTPASGTVALLSEDFNAATNAWTTTNTSTVGVPDTAAWTLQPDGFTYSGTTFHSNDNSQFYLTNSDAQGSGGITATTLESPAFSTVGMLSCSVNFYHYFRYVAGDSAIVEVYNGSVWTPVTSYVATVGTSSVFVNANVDLSSYVGLPVVKVRFRYEATWGYYWAIDNVTVNGVSPVMTYAWSSAPVGFTSTAQNPTAVVPTATTAYTVAVTNTYGCSSTASVTVNANTAPVVNLGIDTTICADASITLNALNNGMSYLWNTTETTQSITVDTVGYGLGSFPFWVTVNNLGCQVTDTIHITFAVCGGIEENSGSIAIYPNPTNGMLYLSSGSFDDNMSVTITTVDGKLIMAEKVNTLNGTQQRKEIDLSKVPAGVYFVRMQGDNLDKISRIVKSY